MNIDEKIDFLLSRKPCEVSEGFSDRIVKAILETESSSDIDDFVDSALSEFSVKVSEGFSDRVLSKIGEEKSKRGWIGLCLNLAAASAIGVAAVWAGSLYLPDYSRGGSDTIASSYAKINKISDEISSIKTVLVQEECLDILL